MGPSLLFRSEASKEIYIDLVFREILALKRRWVCG